MFRSMCVACLLLLVSLPASAAGPRADWQSAELGWHIDFDAARESSWLRKAIATVWSNPAVKEKLAKVPEPLKPLAEATVHSVTYLQNEEVHVVVIDLDADLDALQQVLGELPGSTRSEDVAGALHVTKASAWNDLLADWIPDAKEAPERPVVVCVQKGRVIVGDDRSAVVKTARSVQHLEFGPNFDWPRGAVACVQSRRAVTEVVEVRKLTIRAGRQLHFDGKLEFANNSAAQAVCGMLTPESLMKLAPFPGELQPPIEEPIETKVDPEATSMLSLTAGFDGFRLPEDRDRILQFLGAALQTECVGKNLRVRWTSSAQLTYEQKQTGGLKHYAFTAKLSPGPTVAALPK